MQLPRAIIFDLDNTLAESFTPPLPEMAARFERVLARIPTAIMSAASLNRIKTDVLPTLTPAARLEELTLFTANAAQCYSFQGGSWVQKYAYGFTTDEHERILRAIKESVVETGLDATPSDGDQIVDYVGYIAFTALGTNATKPAKKAWDPDASKRYRLRDAIQKRLPEFDVYIGGATSVDVTPRGINKKYGVEQYAKMLNLSTTDMLYVGDALYEGGNDQVVIATGIHTRQVSGPEETAQVIDELLQS